MHQKTLLDNGVRLVTEQVPSRLVSVGIWVDVGSRDEHDLNNGCAHFVEHMLFKGTKKRSAQRIARELDMLGGMANAFTSNETTCFYATILDNQLPLLADLFADIFLSSLFVQEEVDREREVILQEISMVDDTPDDQVHELFAKLLWGRHPLGHTVLGSREVVAALNSHHLREYVKQFYRPDRILIAAAGQVDHPSFCRLWQDTFAALEQGGGVAPVRKKPEDQPLARKIYNKPLEQVHMVLGTYGLPITAEARYLLFLLNVLLGGNMSSRLFQEIREKRGLAYSIYSYLNSYTDSGALGIYLGVDPASVNEAMALVGKEINGLRHEAVSTQELSEAKDYAKAGVFLAAENMESRMTRLARNELCFGRFVPLEEVIAGIDAVSAEAVQALAATLFSKPLTVAGLGPLTTDEIDWKSLPNSC